MTHLEDKLRAHLTETAPDTVDASGWADAARARAKRTSARTTAVITLAVAVLLGAGALGLRGRDANRSTMPAYPKPLPSQTTAKLQGIGWMAFHAGEGFAERVHLVGVDGSNDHAIAPELPGRTLHPDFSHDGTHLAFDQLDSEDGVDQVYVSDGNGNNARVLARCRPPKCLGHWEAAWSPDSRRLAISIAEGPLTDTGPTRNGLAIVDLATQKVTAILLHASTEGQDHFARWSPDGSSLVFWRERNAADGTTQTAIFRLDLDGRAAQQLTPWEMLAGDPDWSPDGNSIVFATRPLLVFPLQGQSELFVMNPDGTGVRQLTHNGLNGPRAGQPRWAPDGQTILYVRASASGFPRHIHAINRDGTDDTPILTDLTTHNYPASQPQS